MVSSRYAVDRCRTPGKSGIAQASTDAALNRPVRLIGDDVTASIRRHLLWDRLGDC